MNKQKASTPDDFSIKTPKIRKLLTPTSTETQPTAESTNSSQKMNPESNKLDELTQLWQHAKKNQITISPDEVRIAELEKQLIQENLEIGILEERIVEEKLENARLVKCIKDKCKKRDIIIEKQRCANELTREIEVHTVDLIHAHEEFEKIREQFVEFYNQVDTKQQAAITYLTEKYNNEVPEEIKELRDEFELQCRVFSNLETECAKLEQDMREKIQMENEKKFEIEEYEAIIAAAEREFEEESERMAKLIREEEAQLKSELEEKYELGALIDENSKKYDEFYETKYKKLESVASECENRIEYLISREQELKEGNIGLSKEIDELENTHRSLISKKDLELDDCRKQIKDLTIKNTEVDDKLNAAVAKSKELTEIRTKGIEENKEVKNLLRTKENEITKVRGNFEEILQKNKGLEEKIRIQNDELIVVEEEIGKVKSDWKIQEVERDERFKKQAAMKDELAGIDRQVAEECEKLTKLVQEAENKEISSSKEREQLNNEIKEKDDAISRKEKINNDLKLEIERKQSEDKKKIEEATELSKKCALSGHERRIEEQKIKTDELNRILSNEKVKEKQENEKRKMHRATEKERYETQMKNLQLKYNSLKKESSKIQKENDEIMMEIKKAEALIPAKHSKEKTNPTSSTLRSILKSPGKEKQPEVVQKVQFECGSSLDPNHLDGTTMLENAERRPAESGPANRPDWTKIQIPMNMEEPDTTLPIVVVERPERRSANRPDWTKIQIPIDTKEPGTSLPVVVESEASKPSQGSQESQSTQPKRFFTQAREHIKSYPKSGKK